MCVSLSGAHARTSGQRLHRHHHHGDQITFAAEAEEKSIDGKRKRLTSRQDAMRTAEQKKKRGINRSVFCMWLEEEKVLKGKRDRNENRRGQKNKEKKRTEQTNSKLLLPGS